MAPENLFDLPPGPPGAEEDLELLASGAVRVERIVSRGHASPPGFFYDQPEDEWVVLLSGEAVLAWDDGARVTLRPGDWLLLPAHRRHRVESTTADPPCVWLAIHGRLVRGGG